MYAIRKVTTPEDLQKVIDLWESNPKMLRSDGGPRSSPALGTVYCALDEQERPVGTLRVFSWSKLPMYTIGGLYIRKGTIQRYDFANPKNPITPILDTILGEMEAKGFYTWLYVRAISRGYHHLEKQGHDLLACSTLGRRYERYVQEVVPAGQRSAYETHDNLLGHAPWSKPTMIVLCTLRNDLRPCDAITREPDFY